MTRYAVDEGRSELVAIWDTGQGAVAMPVATLPTGLGSRHRLALAAELTGLSEALWRCYTHPATAADSLEINTEGWRRQQTRDGFDAVAGYLRRPNLPDERGLMIVSYDPVVERANQVGRTLHEAADQALTEAVIADVEAEVHSVEKAELGDLSGRSVQAVQLTRQDASPVQVAAADQILAGNPLGGDQLFLDLDPTSACVAAAHWLKAAADVVSAVSGHAASRVVLEADNIEAIPVTTPTDVLELMEAGHSPTDVVTSMIRDAMAVADGDVADLDTLLEKIDEAEEFADDHVPGPAAGGKRPRIRLTPLDPKRPARDMLEDLLTGIRGCWLLYYEYAERRDLGDGATDAALDQADDEIKTGFCNEVHAMAASHRHRLALEPPPTHSTPTGLRLIADDGDGAAFDINLEAGDTCEQFVAAVLESEQPDLPRDIIGSVLQLEHDDSGRLLALLIAHGIGYLVTMKEAGIAAAQLDAAVAWVGTEFGVEYAGPAAVMAGLAGHRQSQRMLAKQLHVIEPTFEQLADFLGPDLFPATIWLCTGLVATAGDGDISWLRRYRLASREDTE